MKNHNDAPLVSIVIPMRNEEQYISKCLQSIFDQDYHESLYEVIVIDGNSEDRSREMVETFARERDNLHLLENPRWITPISLNMGIRKARGDVIIYVLAHSYLEKDFIAKNVEYLTKTGADCVGGPIQTIGADNTNQAIALAMSSPFGVGNSYFRYLKKSRYVDTVAFGAYRREVFDKIGLFDETLVRNQDFELNHRLVVNGGKILLTPEIKSYYYARGSIPKLFKQYFDYGYWKVKVIQKDLRALRFRYQVPPFFILTLILTGIVGIFSRVSLAIFFFIVLAYLVAVFVFSVKIAVKSGLRHLPKVPIAFFTLHFGFGLGFLGSFVKAIFRR